jgi:hypothetical protein
LTTLVVRVHCKTVNVFGKWPAALYYGGLTALFGQCLPQVIDMNVALPFAICENLHSLLFTNGIVGLHLELPLFVFFLFLDSLKLP